MKKRLRKIILLLIIVLAFFGLLSAFFGVKAVGNLKKAAGAIKLQDLDAAKAHLAGAKRDFQITKTALIPFTPLRIIPLFGWYVADVQRGASAAVSGLEAARVFAEAITPYADVLGLKGQGTFLGGTAQERLAKALETLSKVTPQLDAVGSDLAKARSEVDKIETWRYPNILPANPGTKIKNIKNTIDQLESLIVDTKPLVVVLPQIMGQDKEKKYLVLFQNDKELRPTGGFITAYAIFNVNKGVITAEGSEDIYQLDNTLTKKIPAPAPILQYLPNVPTLNIRDSNLSADYYSSMKQFESLYAYTRVKKEIDGIITLDTQFVLSMMEVLGPLEVDGSKFTTDKVDSCDCPQIIYELEKHADQPVGFEKEDRKGIIGVLMNEMMNKAFNAPKSAWPNILGSTIGSLREKHLLLYFKDKELQEAAEIINFAGRLHQYDGDYFHINESNFGGAKSNLYVQEKVKQTVKKGKDGKLIKNVLIEYKYPRKMDNCSLERKGGLCLAGIYRDWLRIYVPKGSQIVKSTGAEFKTSQEYDKTVFDTFFELRPEGALKIELEYTLPIKLDGQYKLLIQKQPGIKGHTYEVEAFGKKQRGFPLDTDKELVIKL